MYLYVQYTCFTQGINWIIDSFEYKMHINITKPSGYLIVKSISLHLSWLS